MERSFTTFLPYLPIGGSVVEIGCGGGDFLLPFSRAGYQVGGFEPSPESASQARAQGISIFGGFATDDERTRKVLHSADLVMSNHSLEHHYDPNVFLSLCALHMKPESVLGITVPNGDGEFLLMAYLFILHLDSYTPVSFERMLNKHGFRVIYREIGAQLRFYAILDPELSPLKPLMGTSPEEIRNNYHSRFLSQLLLSESFSIKGSRPFRGINYEFCESDNYWFRNLKIKRINDGSSLINYQVPSLDQSIIILK